jgi:hypothetical protein
MASIDQVLTVLTGTELGDDRPAGLSLQDRRHGHDGYESGERRELGVCPST